MSESIEIIQDHPYFKMIEIKNLLEDMVETVYVDKKENIVIFLNFNDYKDYTWIENP